MENINKHYPNVNQYGQYMVPPPRPSYTLTAQNDAPTATTLYQAAFQHPEPIRTSTNHNQGFAGELSNIVDGNCNPAFTHPASLNPDSLAAPTEGNEDSTVKTFKCAVCSKSYRSNRELNGHMRCHDARPYACHVCKKGFKGNQQLQDHLLIHTGERPFVCEICSSSFSVRKRLKVHMMTHSAEKPHKCNICNKRYSVKCAVKIHMRTHTGEKPHQCDICHKRFSYWSSFTTHKRTHTGERPHVCQICSKSYTSHSGLQSHLAKHPEVEVGKERKIFKCNICTCASFFSNIDLRKHLKTHATDQSHECTYCQKSFAEADSLNKHIQTHTGEKPYTCEFCDKSFATSLYLKKHIAIHMGEEPYPCHLCEKRFVTRQYLNNHINTHTGEQPYKCKICNEGFAWAANLSRHMLSHSTERPHICNICGKGFKCLATLKKHKKTKSCLESGNQKCIDSQSSDKTIEEYSKQSSSVPFIENSTGETQLGLHKKEECTVLREKELLRNPAPASSDPNIMQVAADDHIKNLSSAPGAIGKGLPNLLEDLPQPVPSLQMDGTGIDKMNESGIVPQRQTENIDTSDFVTHGSNHVTVPEHTSRPTLQIPPLEVATFQFTNDQQVNKQQIDKTSNEYGTSPKDRPYVCDICDKDFTTKSGLSRHRSSHAAAPSDVYVCLECGAGVADLKRHMLNHTEDKPHACPICDKRFPRLDSMKFHVKRHNNTKPYPCEFCKKSFKSAAYLKMHVAIHMGEEPHACHLCEKRFICRQYLKDHLDSTHKGKMPYKCQVCGEEFAWAPNLNRHMLIHSNERPHICPICKKAFKCGAGLKKHRKTKGCMELEWARNYQAILDAEEAQKQTESKTQDEHKDKLKVADQHDSATMKEPSESSSNINALQISQIYKDNNLMFSSQGLQVGNLPIQRAGESLQANPNSTVDAQGIGKNPSDAHVKASKLVRPPARASSPVVCPICKKTLKCQAALKKHRKTKGCMEMEWAQNYQAILDAEEAQKQTESELQDEHKETLKVANQYDSVTIKEPSESSSNIDTLQISQIYKDNNLMFSNVGLPVGNLPIQRGGEGLQANPNSSVDAKGIVKNPSDADVTTSKLDILAAEACSQLQMFDQENQTPFGYNDNDPSHQVALQTGNQEGSEMNDDSP